MKHYDHLTESEVEELNTYCEEMNEKSIEAQESKAQTYKHPQTGQAIYYAPCVEHEDDVSKIWHDFRDCETSTYANLSMDWSPYNDPSANDIKMWFALGCPDRRTIGDGKTVGSLTSERLVEALGRQLCISGF